MAQRASWQKLSRMKLNALASQLQASDSLHLISTSSVVPPSTRSKLLLYVPHIKAHLDGHFDAVLCRNIMSVCPPEGDVPISVRTPYATMLHHHLCSPSAVQ